jgi:hypothetical protein
MAVSMGGQNLEFALLQMMDPQDSEYGELFAWLSSFEGAPFQLTYFA